MDPKKIVLARITELDAQRSEVKAKRSAVVDTALAEKRGLTDEQQTQFNGYDTELKSIDGELKLARGRLAEIEEDEEREARAADVRVAPAKTAGGAQVTEPALYRADNTGETSFFKDLYRAQVKNDGRAYARLEKNSQIEKRLPPNGLTTVAGDGGEFAPPLWLVSEYVKLARASRVAIDLFDVQALPSGISSINIPKVSTGTAVGVQTAQNATLTETELTTGSLTTDITTVGGLQTVSKQLLEQSATPFDRVILEDLAGAYAVNINTQSHAGNGTTELRGLTNTVGKQTITWTEAPALPATLLKKIADANQRVFAARFQASDAILMHPRRWSWLISQVDSGGRPIAGVRPDAELNPLAEGTTVLALGRVGTILGTPVYLDATIPTNLGAGTNEDKIYVLHRNDIKVWESPVRAEAFQETFADSLSVLFRLYAYSAMIPDRYGTAVIEIVGTGLIAPTFA